MQKLLRRTALAEAQVARRLTKKLAKIRRANEKTKRENALYVSNLASADIKRAREARKEDYELGPLAPRRDVGTSKDTYGSISPSRLQSQNLTPEQRQKLNPEAWRYANIVPDDRVVLIAGRDKGKIGKVISVSARKQEITVEKLNQVDVAVPEWMQKSEEMKERPVRTVEQPLPLSSVRLVFPYEDPETGVKRDVIASKVLNSNIFHDRHTGRKRWSRYVPGINVTIPWPKKAPRKREDYEGDTLRVNVEARTFVPTLLRPPMPSSIIDELRNKFSKFRTRHTDEYIQAKIQEEEEAKQRKESTYKMLQPMQTIKTLARLALKEERKAKGLYVPKRPKVTSEMLGQAIARAQGLSESPKQETLGA